MAQSPEFPGLPWVPAKAFSTGRPYGPPLWIVIHTTEGSEGLKSAEDGAAYDQRRTDGTSTHFFSDQDTTVHCVKTGDRANAARATGNHFGIHFELCGKAAQTPTQWDDPASKGTIAQAAKIAAAVAKKWGIPVRHLTVAEVRGKTAKGFCSHSDISAAFGESDHTDPGSNYPWTAFLTMVRAELEGDDMPTADEIADAVWAKKISSPWLGVTDRPAGDWLKYADAGRRDLATLSTKVAAALAGDDVDEKAIVQGVLAGLAGQTPEQTAEALKAVLGDQAAEVGRLLAADQP